MLVCARNGKCACVACSCSNEFADGVVVDKLNAHWNVKACRASHLDVDGGSVRSAVVQCVCVIEEESDWIIRMSLARTDGVSVSEYSIDHFIACHLSLLSCRSPVCALLYASVDNHVRVTVKGLQF